MGCYRKRTQSAFLGREAYCKGQLGVFDTAIGKVGVLVCLDIEEDNLLRETAEQCAIIANPAHIPYVATGSWQIAVESMQRRLEWWSCAMGVHIVRCDLPPPGGMGCSMVVTPCETFLAAGARNHVLGALPTNPRRRTMAWQIVRTRSEKLDNNWTRVQVRPSSQRPPVLEAESPPGQTGSIGGEISCSADEDGVFWSRSDGIVHGLPMPEPCVHAQGTSEGSVLVLGRFGGVWEVWPTQNRERVMFEHLWRQAS